MLSRIFQSTKGHPSAVFIGRTSAHFSKVRYYKKVLIRKMYQIFFFAVVMLDLTANLGQFWMLLLDHPIIPSVFVSYLRKNPQKKMRREKSFLAAAVRKLPPSSSKNCFSTWSFGMAPLYTFTINHIVRNFTTRKSRHDSQKERGDLYSYLSNPPLKLFLWKMSWKDHLLFHSGRKSL